MQTPRAEPDMQQILFEAKNRWLRPGEICEILHNYHNFNITPDPPYLPSGGSLYLFDRKALRYFRKDGHHWRKKKDGKTVREAHEKLKAGSVDVLHCYYAHGEDNENFQRRCYWLLDGKYEHIVLVHYRDLSEDTSSNVPQLLGSDLTFQSAQTIPIAGSAPINSFALAKPASQSSSTSNLDWNIQPASSEFEVADSGDFLSEIPLAVSVPGSGFQVESLTRNSITVPITVRGSIFHPYTTSSMNCVSLSGPVNPSFLNQVTSQNLILNSGQNVLETSPSAGILEGSFGFQFNNDNSASALSEFYDSEQNLTDSEEHKLLFQPQCCVDAVDSRTRDSVAQNDDRIMSGLHDGFHVLPEPYSQPITVDDIIQVEEGNVEVAVPPVDEDSVNNDCIQIDNMPHEHKLDLAPQSDFNEHAEVVPSVSSLGTYLYDDDTVDLDKFDSIERWMNKELGSDCYNSLIASDSCTYWNAINSQHDKVQLFSIDDFSPNWAYAGAETKVLISGAFLGGIQPSNIKWCCMFGEVEVLAEVLMTNAIRCLAPPHSPGRVPFYITCSNRLACSEVREFEYRENPPNMQQMLIDDEPVSEDEIFLQIQFAKMLSIGSDEKRLLCSIKNCAKCIITKVLAQMLIDDEPGWEKIEKETKACQGYLRNLRNGLLEKLLKGKLYEWLVCKLHEDDKGPNILDDKGQGAIHLAAALGYEWAMAPIFAAGVNPNFRDLHGRTALHWAAHYGREQTIVTLLKLGASPGAIEDPTSKFPVGQTAADLASSRGHKGIAAYLAEADLTSHLNSMSIAENVMGSVSASLAAEEAVENVEEDNIFSSVVETGQISLRESLAAVRNSAQAAARIYAAFRAQSFRHRQLTRNTEHADNACEVLLHSSPNNNVHKIGHFNEYLHASAIKIQQKYRGWKRRKEFLKIRNRIVKIQAHVRGHQVRKQYKQFVWSVGIVEKAILRWRRKRSGLRGFRAENAIRGGADPAVDKVDEYDFLHVGRKQKAACLEKALQRVKSMVLYPEAREQYRRLLASSRDSKAGSV